MKERCLSTRNQQTRKIKDVIIAVRTYDNVDPARSHFEENFNCRNGDVPNSLQEHHHRLHNHTDSSRVRIVETDGNDDVHWLRRAALPSE